MLCAAWYTHVVSGRYSCTVIVLFRFSDIVLCIATNYNAHVLMTFAIIRLIIMLLLRLEKLCLGLKLSGTGTQHLICSSVSSHNFSSSPRASEEAGFCI